ncbi:MAG: 2-nitropropane dioxygenase, partial [Aggregatilineales bacterium]
NYAAPIRVGGAGGIGTPAAGLAAFMMGADFILTGSVNQGCLEADSSMHTKKLLAQAEMTDVMMAPAADMFELGVKLQVLKRGTMFGVRAQKLYEIYREYNSIEEIPAAERARLEKQIFRTSMDDIWQGTVDFFTERDPEQIHRAQADPHKKMALIFRWYLGLSSRWSNNGEKGRELDYQIWCGPAMGAFNQWVRGTYLEDVQNRRVVDVAEHIMRGVAYLYRIRTLESQGLVLPVAMQHYRPEPLA